jgi:hypothetical protein
MYMFYFFFSNDKYIINKKRGYKTNVSYISGTPMKYQNRHHLESKVTDPSKFNTQLRELKVYENSVEWEPR